MRFAVVGYKAARRIAERDTCILIQDNWDDFGFKTSFELVYFDTEGDRHDIGAIKILLRGMQGGYVTVSSGFEKLSEDHCSLGQNQAFYESIRELNEDVRVDILDSLRDVVWDSQRLEEFRNERGLETSLMRSVSESSIQKFRDILAGTATLTAYHFKYKFPGTDAPELEFKVDPSANPPTNIHVIIGRNGVGKTRLLTHISELLRKGNPSSEDRGRVLFFGEGGTAHSSPRDTFANLISVAFSAFDDFAPPSQTGSKTGLAYSYIGLRRPQQQKGQALGPKSPNDLCSEFVRSTLVCLRSSRRLHWRRAMELLETDPLFASLQLAKLTELKEQNFEDAATQVFTNSSSGHKIVLLIATRLVELVSERTLVLIDEPESHLHPPLTASLIRAISDLLSHRNGVAILATHSPVVLQEVPADCVWLLFREDDFVEAERPQMETFAENFGVLTREVFRLEVTNSGFHARIEAAAKNSSSLDDVVKAFDGHLGAEGRAIARSILRQN